jgi:hypothetical protein
VLQDGRFRLQRELLTIIIEGFRPGRYEHPEFLMLRALFTAALLLLHPLTAEARPDTRVQKTAPAKSSKKKKPSRFDPADYLKKKEQHAQTGAPDSAGKPEDGALSLKRQGVVCNPPPKHDESCFGAACAGKDQVQEQQSGQAPVATGSTDSTRLTADLMKTIKENCTQEISAEPSMKPVFEIGVRENEAAGAAQRKEVVPKLGIQASF